MAPVFATPPVLAPAHPTAAPSSIVRNNNPAPHGWTKYAVRPGDSVHAIALRFRTTNHVIVAKNGLPGSGRIIHAGQKLWVPRLAAKATARKARPTMHSATSMYRIRSGDSLGSIATRYGTTTARLLKLNYRSSTTIYAGERLRVPVSHPSGWQSKPGAQRRSSLGAHRVYTVRSGDNLSVIAGRVGTSTSRLLKMNHLANPNHIVTGQEIYIPPKPGVARKVSSSNTFAGRTYSAKVVAAAAANRAYFRKHKVPSRAATKAMITRTARRHGLDPKLALAIGWQESGWNQRQVSVANAIGAMQVIPSSGRWASGMAGRRLNLLNTQDNITAGVIILRSLTRSARTTDQAIAGYYQGLGSVQKNGMYADTRQYVRSVKAHRARM